MVDDVIQRLLEYAMSGLALKISGENPRFKSAPEEGGRRLALPISARRLQWLFLFAASGPRAELNEL